MLLSIDKDDHAIPDGVPTSAVNVSSVLWPRRGWKRARFIIGFNARLSSSAAVQRDPCNNVIDTKIGPLVGHGEVGAPKLVILRDGVVVGYDDSPVAGASINVTATAARPFTRQTSVSPVACSMDTPPVATSRPRPLPSGTYQIVAALSNNTSQVVSDVRDVTI